jgi:hypothetical protein
MTVAAEIPQGTLDVVTSEWPELLMACVETEGGHFD